MKRTPDHITPAERVVLEAALRKWISAEYNAQIMAVWKERELKAMRKKKSAKSS